MRVVERCEEGSEIDQVNPISSTIISQRITSSTGIAGPIAVLLSKDKECHWKARIEYTLKDRIQSTAFRA